MKQLKELEQINIADIKDLHQKELDQINLIHQEKYAQWEMTLQKFKLEIEQLTQANLQLTEKCRHLEETLR